MLKFSVNLSTLFQDRPLLERLTAARAAGFDAVEMWFPYEIPAATLHAAMRECSLEMVGINSAPGDVGAGDWGLAADPRRRSAFLESVHEAMEYAQAIECPNVHVMAGLLMPPSRVKRRGTSTRPISMKLARLPRAAG